MKKKYVIKSTGPRRVPFDLGSDLNPQQRAVVDAPSGEILILAGAGTGKTRTLTYRVARLVAGGVHPERILLVTFTKSPPFPPGLIADLQLDFDPHIGFFTAAASSHHFGTYLCTFTRY